MGSPSWDAEVSQIAIESFSLYAAWASHSPRWIHMPLAVPGKSKLQQQPQKIP
jgi:hypothetical protein